MKKQILTVSDGVLRSGSLLREISSIEMSEENVNAQTRIKAMMGCLVDRNAAVADALHKTAVSSQEMEQAVCGAIVDMQFQDRVMQQLQNVNGALAIIGRAATSLAAQAPGTPVASASEVVDAILREVAGALSLGAMRDRFAAATHLKGVTAPKNTSVAAAPADVELF